MDVVAGTMEGLAQESRAIQEKLEREEYTLTFVLLERGPSQREQRCQVVVMACARVSEVLDMVRLELDGTQDEAWALEFTGQVLPPDAEVHRLGLRSGDTVHVVSKD